MLSPISPDVKSSSLRMERKLERELISAIVVPDGCSGAESASEPSLRIGQAARLINDIPDLWLSREEVGIVISIWCFPIRAYEIEFGMRGDACRTRALVLSSDLRPEPTLSLEEYRAADERAT